MTPEKYTERARRQVISMTSEALSERSRRANAARTPEQRRETALKREATKRAKKAAINGDSVDRELELR